MFKKIQHIHFVGIGGAGMSGIAHVLLNLGYGVSGSDIKRTPITQSLARLGGTIYLGHKPSQVAGSDVVVVSNAIPPDNCEVAAARASKIPVIPRAEMLAELMRMKHGIAVAGTHGKTTTTSMIAGILARGGLDPTIVIGGRLNSLGSSAKLGQGEFMVAEADESDGSFLHLAPSIAVVTTIDSDHLDYYGSMQSMRDTFVQFVNKVPFYGCAILGRDCPNVQSLIPRIEKRHITYGLSGQADLKAAGMAFDKMASSFEVSWQGQSLGEMRIKVPGVHNVSNALGAIAVGLELGIDFKTISRALFEFKGVERRFQIKGEGRSVLVVDDYAHHPVEIKATLSAAKQGWKRRIVAVFQPHRYTRTKILKDSFARAFSQADMVVVTSIYPAGENEIPGVSAKLISDGVKEFGHPPVKFIPNREDIVDYLISELRGGDLVITLGAGDVWQVAEELLERLKG